MLISKKVYINTRSLLTSTRAVGVFLKICMRNQVEGEYRIAILTIMIVAKSIAPTFSMGTTKLIHEIRDLLLGTVSLEMRV